MKENLDGKTLVLGIGGWLIVKGILNLILGFSFGNLINVLLAAVFAFVMVAAVPYTNYIVAAITAIVVLKNLPYNLTHFQIIYLLEAVVDVLCIVLLITNKKIKEHYEAE